MRRTLLRIAIFMLAFGLGVGVSICWRLYQWSLIPYDVSSELYVLELAAPGLRVVESMHACGLQASYYTVKLSDGTAISERCEEFSSPLASARALQTRLANTEIIDRFDVRDDQGRLIGEKILTTDPLAMRLSIYDKDLCVTSSPSVHHLKLYEAGALH